ncbi:MAG: hypothetical protein ACE5HX_13290 [bacterium]
MRSAQILLLLFLLNSAHSEPILRNSLKADTVAKKRSGIIFIPAIFYTPETKLAGGASMMYYFRSSESSEISRPSTISPTFIYTQRKQIISLLFADLYWQQETYHFTGGFSYFNFPDKFFNHKLSLKLSSHSCQVL